MNCYEHACENCQVHTAQEKLADAQRKAKAVDYFCSKAAMVGSAGKASKIWIPDRSKNEFL